MTIFPKICIFKKYENIGVLATNVRIARALVYSPPILMTDEPTGNLDSKYGKEIMELFKSLKEEGQTIIMVTHNPENTALSTRTICLRDGRVDAVSVAL